MKAAVFLDRDGVINENRADHVVCPDDVEFVPGARQALALLAAAQLPCFVVTNQAAIGRGLLTEEGLAAIHKHIATMAGQAGGILAGFYHCPHLPAERCRCRKPRPGLFEQAAADHAIDLGRSYYIGDALSDVEAGQAAGCTTILVRTGRGLTQLLHDEARYLQGYYVAPHLEQAVRWIIHRERGAVRPTRAHGMLRPFGARGIPSLEFV